VNALIGNIDKQILDLLQKDFPLSSRPFAIIGERLGITEEEILARVENLYKDGVIRQISAIFDTRSLGYDSCLVAMQVPPEKIDDAAAVIGKHPGVSHNYARSHYFNLWFTIATPPGNDLKSDVSELSERVGAISTLLLPSLRVFKIGVKLDVTGNKNPMKNEVPMSDCTQINNDTLPPLTESDIRVIRELQENLPIEATPFRSMAVSLGITEDDIFTTARRFIKEGRMRRFAAVLRHRKAGFKANAMGVWRVPSKNTEKVGAQLSAFNAVSHCYERSSYPPTWPYNIFTMVHAHTEEECLEILKTMSERVGIRDYDYLFSKKEYKKIRVRYFV
jgi:DNA-binding Lrp family transcriptional regulator